ncbi:MAG TPA: hypothetical protein VLA14_00145 [Polyangia bacterium]|nr:hypothetical protein [Polyangia bacterium]
MLAFAPATRAQPAGASVQGASSRASLVSERQRLRGELERVNAEIDALKRSRGMRDDYRLRDRLADAEALARRLTELDARLGANRGATTALPAPADEPRVSSADGPAELDAKADILADQARRLAARGDSLLARAHDLRDRQTLRRRVGQMEHDPFSPLEGSKRRAMAGSVTGAFSVVSAPGSTKSTPTLGGASSTPGAVGSTPSGTMATSEPSSPQAPSVPNGGGATAAAPAGGHEAAIGGAALGTPGAASSPAPNSAPNSSPSSGSTPSGIAVSSPTAAPTPTSGAASDSAALSVQLRDLVDATTLAEIQHLEASAGPGASTDALERAGAALKARADRLRQQAAALRASEHPRAR